MGLFKNNKKVGLLADVIRCDEPSYLIWKWHPDGKQYGEDKREYSVSVYRLTNFIRTTSL